MKNIEAYGGKICTDRHNRFWLCSPAVGAICFDNPNRDLSNPKIYLPGKKVTSMFEDHQGTFWFCTMDEGIYSLPTNASVVYRDERRENSSNNITAIHRAPSGNVYFGDDEGNLNVITPTGQQFVERFSSVDGYNRVLSIQSTAGGNLWVATDEGLYYGRRHRFYKIKSVLATPKAILVDREDVWCSTSARIYRVSASRLDTIPFFTIPKRFTALGKDGEGNVWAGGIEGIYCSHDSFRTNQGEKYPQLCTRIVSIESDPAGFLWVVTPESGLLKVFVRNGAITAITPINPLLRKPIHTVQSLFLAPGGQLWLATNTGIYGIDTHTWNTTHYDRHSGIASNDVHVLTLSKDTLWVGTASGVTRIVVKPPPVEGDFPTYITRIKYQINDETVDVQLLDSFPANQELVVPPHASLVSMRFTGLDYRSKGSVHFQCVLTKLLPPFRWWTTDNLTTWIWNRFGGESDTTWMYQNNLEFGVHLPSGRYKLKVTAFSANEVRSNRPDEKSFVMRPKWYNTVWFTLLLWAIFAYILWRIYRARVKLREMAIAVARFRLIALQAQINPHFVGNSVNAIQRFFYPPNPVHASVYTATFTRLLRRTLHFSEKTFVPFHEELSYNRDYMELARLRLGDNKFRYTITGNDQIPPDLPFPSLFLQPILENATIHGTSNRGLSVVSIAFYQQDGRLFCEITDNGPGIQASAEHPNSEKDEARKSKGITILRNKVYTLNQLYQLDMHLETADLSRKHPAGQGTKVTISFEVSKVMRALNLEQTIERKTAAFNIAAPFNQQQNTHETN